MDLSPFWKGLYSKRKEFAPLGRVYLFSEGFWRTRRQTGSQKCCLPFEKWQEIFQIYQVPLILHILISTGNCQLHILLLKQQIIITYPKQWDILTLVQLKPDIPCICKQCRSRSVGFWRSQLIWIYTVCCSVCEFISINWIKESDWLTVRSGCGIW